MPSTQHTQACVFIKITVKIGTFLPPAARDQLPGSKKPSEKLGCQIQEQV